MPTCFKLVTVFPKKPIVITIFPTKSNTAKIQNNSGLLVCRRAIGTIPYISIVGHYTLAFEASQTEVVSEKRITVVRNPILFHCFHWG